MPIVSAIFKAALLMFRFSMLRLLLSPLPGFFAALIAAFFLLRVTLMRLRCRVTPRR